jgi:poly(3-hydroxybutyrate) depolymerase
MNRKRAFALCVGALCALGAARTARADELELSPARDGSIGAWLVAGPLRATGQTRSFLRIDTELAKVPDGELLPAAGLQVAKGAAFRLVASSSERVDLSAALKPPHGEVFALAAGLLRVTEPTRVLLVLGVSDGVRATVDGREVHLRDVSRPLRALDDTIALELAAGDHPVVLRLHQRTGRWDFRVRVLDAADFLPPRSVRWVLPGVGDAAAIAASMASVDLELEVGDDHYRPAVQVRFPSGAPAGAPLPVRVSAWRAPKNGPRSLLFQVPLGDVPRTARGVLSLRAELPAVAAAELAGVEDDGEVAFEVEVAGRSFPIARAVRGSVRRALGRAGQALAGFEQLEQPMLDREVVRATLRHSAERLRGFVRSGDKDVAATVAEAEELERFVARLEAGQDPVATARGPVRLAYLSELDQRDHPFGLYVPASYAPASDRRFPLVVALHGLNGKPMQMLRWFFGRDDPGRNGEWEDRHVGKLPDLEAFVVAPSGMGNLGYRDAGEVDVVRVRDWVASRFPIEPGRVYVTGPSMGGIGAAAVALRFPDRFAASAPLCGYHSYFLRNDMSGKKLRPWERSLAEYYSNVWWAENGLHTPMYVVHGTRDLPVANSGVLINKYKQLGYAMLDEHPEEGHNVWQDTYSDFKAYRWLSRHKRDPEPARVVLKTSSLRHADHAWVHVTRLSSQLGWGQVDATVRAGSLIAITTSGVDALRLDRTSRVGSAPVTVKLDSSSQLFGEGEPLELHRQSDGWVKGAPPPAEGLSKARALSGPIHDAYLEPLVFVYGTRDPAWTLANLEVARALAEPPAGAEVRWPVMADVDVDDAIAQNHALFLVGNPASNAWLKSIEERLPIRVEGRAITAGGKRFEGPELGAMFIHPNPRWPQRYVVVLQAPELAGLLRGLSLPRLLPDFVIYDASVASARGSLVLGPASVLAGGLFDTGWRLPEVLEDPGRATQRTP